MLISIIIIKLITNLIS